MHAHPPLARAPSPGATLLPAVRVSRAVLALARAGPGIQRGTVHSVFARAVNLRLARGGWVSVTAAELPLAANGVAVALPAGCAWPALGVRVGQPCALDRAGLWLPLAPLRIDWADAPRWTPRPPVRPGLPPARLAARLARLQAILLRTARAGLAPLLQHRAAAPVAAPDALLARRALSCMHQLRRAARAGDPLAAAAAARELAGLGPGLTPAGDDLLAGFAATWLLAARALGRDVRAARRLTAAVAAAAGPRASPLGAGWLGHAARGEVGEAQGALLTCLLAREEAPELEAAAARVLAYGATSGADWLAGVVLAGQAALEEPWGGWAERGGALDGERGRAAG
jgi:hypothetical protein